MLKYIPGILLVQLVTIGLFLAVTEAGLDNTQHLLTIILLEALFCVLAGFWFFYMGRQRHLDELETVKEAHAREREKIRVNAERQKSRSRHRASRKSSRKPGAPMPEPT